MIIVQETFNCKPGNASKLAKLFKEVMARNKEFVNVMTDMTGDFNKVVITTKYENLTAYEKSWEEYQKDEAAMKEMMEKMKGYTEMYLTGSRQIFHEW